jgi:arginyl-tRNA synthetase
MNSFEQEIANSLEATGFIQASEVLKLITVPQDTAHGNFSMPCFVLAKTLRKAPKIIAEELAEKAKVAATRSANPFTAAVEAGKDAYVAEKRRNESKSIAEGRPTYPVDDADNK